MKAPGSLCRHEEARGFGQRSDMVAPPNERQSELQYPRGRLAYCKQPVRLRVVNGHVKSSLLSDGIACGHEERYE